jgi:hypothetical protein
MHEFALPRHRSYVEQGRNPDIFTRAFIERVAGENQYTNGKIKAVSVRERDAMSKVCFATCIHPSTAVGIPRLVQIRAFKIISGPGDSKLFISFYIITWQRQVW